MKLLQTVLKWLAQLFKNTSVPDIKEMEFMPYQPLEEFKLPEMDTNQEKFLKVCLEALDTDPSTPDNVKDELGCADTVSALIRKIYKDFPIILSTKDLDMKLFMDKRFKRVTEPAKGVILVSPRTVNTVGHTGVFITSERIASNNSKTGLFQGNYTWDSWIKEMRDRRGLKIYLYQLVD